MRYKRLFLLLWIIAFSAMFPVAGSAEELTPRQILQKADMARGNVAGIIWEIDILSREPRGEQQRRLRVTARNHDALAEFLVPGKVKGQKLLMRDRNMWFIKPGLRKPVPLSPRQKLLGMASNGDIASTNYAGDYEVVETTPDRFNGEDCYRFQLKATSKKVTYDHIVYWVSRERLVGVKADFFTVSGKHFKSATFEYDHHLMVGRRRVPFVSSMTIVDALLKDQVTEMRYGVPETAPVPDAAFNLNLLVR